MLGGDEEKIALVFEDSIADVLDRYIDDERLKTALFGQGIIGTWGGPYDHGTASIKLMHYQGDMGGQGPVWGYVEGGMGMISLRDRRRRPRRPARARLRRPGRPDHARRGSRARGRDDDPRPDGDLERRPEGDARGCSAPTRSAPPTPPTSTGSRAGRSAARWSSSTPPSTGCPNWTAAPGEDWPARATVDVCGTMAEAQQAFERCAAGEPAVGFGEIYVQTGYDPSPAPEGKQLMSVFGQYAPYDIADGDWDSAREGVARQFIDLIGRFAPDFEDVLADYEVLGPPDIESRIGLTGGNIFQGEVTPDQMWEGRLTARTPVEGVYLCGAATHPAGSVIALNGRNAAAAVLADRAREIELPP